MRYLQDRGVSLKQSIRLGQDRSGGPIGPKLTETLVTLGLVHPFPYYYYCCCRCRCYCCYF